MAYYRFDTKDTTDGTKCLNLKRMQDCGVIAKNTHSRGKWAWHDAHTKEVKSSISYEANTLTKGAEYLRLGYAMTRTQQELNYEIKLLTTALHYGGERYWFACPICHQRTTKLYLAGNAMFICRKCANLTYLSQQQSPIFRWLEQAQRLHEALGGDGCDPSRYNVPPKPKNMHTRTYKAKIAKMVAYCNKFDQALALRGWRF